jgi:hypothetical protein
MFGERLGSPTSVSYITDVKKLILTLNKGYEKIIISIPFRN